MYLFINIKNKLLNIVHTLKNYIILSKTTKKIINFISRIWLISHKYYNSIVVYYLN